jgi:hypothetical protein
MVGIVWVCKSYPIYWAERAFVLPYARPILFYRAVYCVKLVAKDPDMPNFVFVLTVRSVQLMIAITRCDNKTADKKRRINLHS